MSHLYTIERHTHGWLICAPQGKTGVPMNALAECQPLFPANAVMDAGIARHYRAWMTTSSVFCVTTKPGSAAWRAEITASLWHMSPHDRWWYGVDVGTSSAAMFAVFCPEYLRQAASEHGNRSTPLDADDLGRCLRLLKAMPEWRGRLNEVAEAYPETAWPEIVAAWGELELVDTRHQNAILNECHMSQKRRMS